MRKILLIFNGKSAANLLSFGCYIAGVVKGRLLGLFPEEIEYDESPRRIVTSTASQSGITDIGPAVETNHTNDIQADIRRFQQVCERKGIHASVHNGSRFTIADLADESRFADLIIVDATPRKGFLTESVHERIVKELVSAAECPVIIAPASFEPVEEVVFWYNRSASAAFAMKEFAYIFSFPDDIKATVALTLNDGDDDTGDTHAVREWLSRYYEYGDVVILKEHQEKTLFDYLLRKKKVMVVTGAHGRAALRRFFQHSQADLQLKTLPFPLLITHH